MFDGFCKGAELLDTPDKKLRVSRTFAYCQLTITSLRPTAEG